LAGANSSAPTIATAGYGIGSLLGTLLLSAATRMTASGTQDPLLYPVLDQESGDGLGTSTGDEQRQANLAH
jgi:hypothetical protein